MSANPYVYGIYLDGHGCFNREDVAVNKTIGLSHILRQPSHGSKIGVKTGWRKILIEGLNYFTFVL